MEQQTKETRKREPVEEGVPTPEGLNMEAAVTFQLGCRAQGADTRLHQLKTGAGTATADYTPALCSSSLPPLLRLPGPNLYIPLMSSYYLADQ